MLIENEAVAFGVIRRILPVAVPPISLWFSWTIVIFRIVGLGVWLPHQVGPRFLFQSLFCLVVLGDMIQPLGFFFNKHINFLHRTIDLHHPFLLCKIDIFRQSVDNTVPVGDEGK